MTKTLQQKIDDYKKTISEHKKENREYFRELIRLIGICEDKFGTILGAPADSHEVQSIKLQEKKMPKIHFKEGALSDFRGRKKSTLRKQIICLYRDGYDYSTIGNILELHIRTVKAVIRYLPTKENN